MMLVTPTMRWQINLQREGHFDDFLLDILENLFGLMIQGCVTLFAGQRLAELGLDGLDLRQLKYDFIELEQKKGRSFRLTKMSSSKMVVLTWVAAEFILFQIFFFTFEYICESVCYLNERTGAELFG